jgi:hypothetical protein
MNSVTLLISTEWTRTYDKHILLDRSAANLLAHRSNPHKIYNVGLYPLLCGITADRENTASFIVECCTLFTDLLSGNELTNSVTVRS